MSSVLTNKFRIHNAKSFKEGFDEGTQVGIPPADIGINTNIYMSIGKITPWSESDDIYSSQPDSTINDFTPPSPRDHVQNQYEVWRNMIAAKKILPTDVSHIIPRYDWESGYQYEQYSDLNDTLVYDTNQNSTNKPFYVMTDEFNVYKCLFNNNNDIRGSLNKPIGTGVEPVEYNDGYIWKYMYTVSPAESFKFMTKNFIPIKTLEEEPQGVSVCSSSNLQWEVQNNAVDGVIDVISRRYKDVDSSGDKYDSVSSVTSTSISGNTIQFGSLAKNDDYYNGMTVYFEFEGESFEIVQYTPNTPSNGTDTIVLKGDVPTTITSPSVFKILPTVKVTGDGTGLKAVAIMGTGAEDSVNTDKIDKVKVLLGGSGYTRASVEFVGKRTEETTKNALFDVIIPPAGGHGKDALGELGGFFIMLNTSFEYDEGVDLTILNDYRQIGLIKQPLLLTNNPATDDIYVQSQTLSVTSNNINGNIELDDIVTQNSTGASGIVVDVIDDNSNKLIRITNVKGTFETGEDSGLTFSPSNATVDSVIFVTPEPLLKNSGEVLFVENRTKIQRGANQIEDIKIVLEF